MGSQRKKEIRRKFREAVFARDNYKCRHCGLKADPAEPETILDAHHIISRDDAPNGGYEVDNGITLCKECHLIYEIDSILSN